MTDYVLIGLASLFTSALTAAMGVGGGVVLLTLMAQVLPPQVVVPLHGAAQLMSNTNRTVLQRRHIDWTFMKPFAIGCLIGGLALTPFIMKIPTSWGQMALGIFILVAIWKPTWLALQRLRPSLAGASTTALSMAVAATGPLVMSLIKKKEWTRHTIVATHGMAMMVQHGVKVIAFSSASFNFIEWWPMLAIIAVATFAGNHLGALMLGKLNETQFQRALNIMLTILAARLFYQGLLQLH